MQAGNLAAREPRSTRSESTEALAAAHQPQVRDRLRDAVLPLAQAAISEGNVSRWIVRLLAACCLGLIPWTIGLALTLPRSYLVGNWPLAWTGFDAILLCCLGTTAWGLWRRRLVAIPASMITAVLLLCDAWFDIVTAHGGRCLAVSITTAVAAEIPIATLLGLISLRLLHASGLADRGTDVSRTVGAMWRASLITSRSASWPPDRPQQGSHRPRVVGYCEPSSSRAAGSQLGARLATAPRQTMRPITTPDEENRSV